MTHYRLHSTTKSHLKLNLSAITLLLVCGFIPIGAQEDRRPQRGFHPGNSYALSEIETIGMANGNLSLSIPLGSLPAGRGGSSGFTLGLTYNSKNYDTHVDPVPNELGQDENRTHLNFSENGGWRYTLPVGYTMRVLSRLNEEPGPPCAAGVSEVDYQRNAFVWKVQVVYPDGSAHEFRPVGFNDQFADGFFNISPNGWLFMDVLSHPGPNCSHSETLATTAPIVYYSTDGSYTRLVVEHNSNPADHVGANNQWTLYFPDGRRVTNQPGQPQRAYDRNNHYLDQLGILHNNHPATKIIDEIGRYVIVEIDSQSDPSTGMVTRQDYIYVKGTGGEELRWTIRWKQIYVYKEYRATVETGAIGRGNNYLTTWEGTLLVVDQITLPAQAGGLTYKFGYNAGDYVGDTQQLSYGWGELSSVTLPSGAKASYTYGLDGSTATAAGPTWKNVLKNRPNRKELTYRQEHDLAPISNTACDPQLEACTTEVWTYSAISQASQMIPHTATITGPDGGITTETIEDNPNSPYHGRTLVSVQPDGTKIENLWRENRAPGMNGTSVNPFIKTVFTSIKDAAGNYVLTATKDYDVDKNGNVTRVTEYDSVPYSGVPPTGPPQGVNPKRVATNTYHAATPDALDTTSDDPDIYHRASAPQLLSAVQSAEVGDGGAQPLTRSEFFYDNPQTTGNMTERRTWASQKGAYSNPLSSTNSISVINEYDPQVLGKLTQTTDPRGVRTEHTYGLINGFADLYPTEIRVAAGTSVQRTERREYDFNTALVTRVTDVDNNVSTVTAHDVFGRAALVKAAEGSGNETRTAMDYSNTARRVIVRADLSTVGDGKLVTIQHYDQLGRVRLTRQLEDAAQSATDESQGIKGQTRYLYSGSNSFQLVSNPYRATTSGTASAESTMGWTRTKADNGGRVREVQTFGGSGLPAPWGSSSSTTGTVITAYDANFTTVTDQASKARKTGVDALGRLKEVYEDPNSSNHLTSYDYDLLDNLTRVTQGTQPQRSFVYDSLKRLRSASNPESGTISYQYDNNGNLTQKTDARVPAVTTTYIYDELNRLTSRSSDGTPAVTYAYDAVGVLNSKGRLTSVSSTVSAYSYGEYDALGRVKIVTQTTDEQVYPMSYGYDLAGNMKTQTYPSGRIVTSEFDSAGRLAGVKNQASGVYYAGAAATDAANRVQYSAHGATKDMKLGNGLWEHANFNSRLQVTEIGLGTTQGGIDRLKINYDYGTTNNNGNLLSQTIAVPTVAGVTGFTSTQTYTYDALNRLETAKENAGASWTQNFSYDRYGNRNFASGTTFPAQLNASNNPFINTNNNRIDSLAVGQTNVIYDNAGNLTRDVDGHTYVYDGENKLTNYNGGASSSGGATYYYDGDGRRVKKLVGGAVMVTTVFVYNIQGQLVAEYSDANPSGAAGTSYLTNDTLGSPRVITGPNKEVRARHDYLPFGEELFGIGGRTPDQGYTGDNVRQKFTSKERDNETGLDYFLARYYSSTQGRFTSPDEFKGGARELFVRADEEREKQALAYSDIFTPQSLNKYQYCLNNPLRYIDPDGHCYRIVEEKDKDGKKVKRYVWDRNYTYKEGDKNGAPSNHRYIDSKGRAIQLWGDNSKNPKKEQDHGYQVVEPGGKREKYTAQVGEAPTSFVSYNDTRNALLGAGYNEHYLDMHPDHWGGRDFSQPKSPTLHVTLFPQVIVFGKGAMTNFAGPMKDATFHNEKHTQAGSWGDLGKHLRDFVKSQ